MQIDFDKFRHDIEDRHFVNVIHKILKLVINGTILPVEEESIFNSNGLIDTYIFEGAQGILLDQNFGNRPFITKSNTTSKNAISLINKYRVFDEVEIVYVTRAYQTYHGYGPFNDMRTKYDLIDFQFETNKYNPYQGEFKIDFLDLDKLNYSLECDSKFSSGKNIKLVITCLDQIGSSNINYYTNNSLKSIHFRDLQLKIDKQFDGITYSYSNCANDLIVK